MDICPSCGVTVPEGAVACPSCGAPLGARREAIRNFARPVLLTSPWTFLVYVPFVYLASLLAVGGWMVLGFLVLPLYVLAGLLGGAVVAYVVMESIGVTLKALGRLTFLHYLAACAVLSFGLGFLPSRLGHLERNMTDLLLEDYAESLVMYAVLLYVLSGVWWFIYWASGGTRK